MLVSHYANGVITGTLPSLGPDSQIEMQHDIFHQVIPLMVALTSHDADNVINRTIVFFGQDNQNKVQYDFFGHLMPFTSHDTNDTSSDIKCHKTTLNNHLSMENVMVPLMALSA